MLMITARMLLGVAIMIACGAVRADPQSLVAAVLPASRSVQVGHSATAFATLINTGTVTAIGCRVTLVTALPLTFAYQTTHPLTNQATGTPNTPVAIPSGATQSFVFSITPTADFGPTDLPIDFTCDNAGPAPLHIGLNSLLASASSTPVPDIVALAATPSGDGIVTTDEGSGLFAVAAVNLGSSSLITVSLDTGSASLPLGITLCQTDTSTGACRAPPANAVTTEIAPLSTPTFGVFVTATGPVADDPAANRLFVRFRDPGGATRGATSVAARSMQAAASPGPPPAPPSADFKARTWTVRPLYGNPGGSPKNPEAPGFGTFSKHTRPAYWPDGGLIIIHGGDHSGGPYPSNYTLQSGRNEMYSYDIGRDQWRVVQRYCRPDGGLQPSGPDEVGWTWDSKRKVFWHLWGFQWARLKPGDTGYCPGNTMQQPLWFDPVTATWRVPDFPVPPPKWGGSSVPNFGIYDPSTDNFFLAAPTGGGNGMYRYDVGNNVWLPPVPGTAEMLRWLPWHDTMPAYDPAARQIYIVPPGVSRLVRYDIQKAAFEDLGEIPLAAAGLSTPGAETMPIFDTVSGVLLYPHKGANQVITLFSYDPRRRQWAQEPMPAGETVRGLHAVFDPVQNVLLIYGHDAKLFFYRYAEKG